MITGTTVKVAKQDSSKDTNNYSVSFNLGLKGTNQTDQNVNWYLFRGDGDKITEGPNKHDLSSITCSLKSVAGDDNETRYSYEGCKADGSSGIINQKFSDYELVGYGTLEGNKTNEVLTSTMTETDFNSALGAKKTPKGLTNQVLVTNPDSSSTFDTYTYFLIVEFPDSGSNQNGTANANFGKTISVTFDEISGITTTTIPAE